MPSFPDLIDENYYYLWNLFNIGKLEIISYSKKPSQKEYTCNKSFQFSYLVSLIIVVWQHGVWKSPDPISIYRYICLRFTSEYKRVEMRRTADNIMPTSEHNAKKCIYYLYTKLCIMFWL